MEKVERLSDEETYLWIPFKLLDQTLNAIFKCLGLLHRDFPETTETCSSPVTLNQPEEEENVVIEGDVVVTTRGSKNDIVMTSRGTKVKAKPKEKERVSSGRPGQHH